MKDITDEMSESTTAETQHTPGPWRIKRHAATCVEDANERTICSTATVASNKPGEADRVHDENLANARLIAAAPELLDALELAESEITFLLGISRRGGGRVLECIRAAIAKATAH